MSMPRKHNFNRVVVVLFALALILVSYAHRAPQQTIDLTAYAMPDGTLPDLCLDVTGDQGGTHAPCPACTLIAGMDLGSAFVLEGIKLRSNIANWSNPAPRIWADNAPRAPPARGPPIALFI